MDELLDRAAKFASVRGSAAVGLTAFLAETLLNEYHPADFSERGLIDGLVFAVAAVCVIQIGARIRRAFRKYLLMALLSAMLF